MISKRIELIETALEVRAVIQPRRDPLLFTVLSFWVFFWTVGGFAILISLVMGQDHHPFIWLWLCAWAGGEVFALSAWLWNAFGTENLRLNRDSLSHARVLLGRTITNKTFSGSLAFTFRSVGPFAPMTLGREQLVFASGTIDVDCVSDSFSFGYQLEQAEADALVAILNSFVARQANTRSHAQNG